MRHSFFGIFDDWLNDLQAKQTKRGQKTNLRMSANKIKHETTKSDRSQNGCLLTSWHRFKICDSLCFWGAYSPAQCPEPGQVVGVVHAVTDCDDFLEALDLNTEDLHRESLCH